MTEFEIIITCRPEREMSATDLERLRRIVESQTAVFMPGPATYALLTETS